MLGSIFTAKLGVTVRSSLTLDMQHVAAAAETDFGGVQSIAAMHGNWTVISMDSARLIPLLSFYFYLVAGKWC